MAYLRHIWSKYSRFILVSALIFFSIFTVMVFLGYFLDISQLRMYFGPLIGYVVSEQERIESLDKFEVFLEYAGNNILVNFEAGLLGLTFGIGTFLLLFLTATYMGLITGILFRDGLGITYLLSITPHSIFELPAIFISTSVGFRIGLLLIAMIRHRTKTGRFPKRLMTDFQEAGGEAISILFFASVLSVFGAFMEAYMTPLWIDFIR